MSDLAPPVPPRRNIEIKAHLSSLADARAIARREGFVRLGVEQQVDTYFCCACGRLKLRQRDGLPSQLIWYVRRDQREPKPSDYRILDVADADALRETLQAALGVRATVSKQREVFLCDHIRIHLDDVRELGHFLELEAVQEAPTDSATDERRVRELTELFCVAPQDFLAGSYADMLQQRGKAPIKSSHF